MESQVEELSKYYNGIHWTPASKIVPKAFERKIDEFLNKLYGKYPSRILLGLKDNEPLLNKIASMLAKSLDYSDVDAFLTDFGFVTELKSNEPIIAKNDKEENASNANVVQAKEEKPSNSQLINNEFWSSKSSKNNLAVDEDINKLFNTLLKRFSDNHVLSLDGFDTSELKKRYDYLDDFELLSDYGFIYEPSDNDLAFIPTPAENRANVAADLLGIKEGMTLKEYRDIFFKQDSETVDKLNTLLSPGELTIFIKKYLSTLKLDSDSGNEEFKAFINKLFDSAYRSMSVELYKKALNSKFNSEDITIMYINSIDKAIEVMSGKNKNYFKANACMIAAGVDLDYSLLATYFLKLILCDNLKNNNELYYSMLYKATTSKCVLGNVFLKIDSIFNLNEKKYDDYKDCTDPLVDILDLDEKGGGSTITSLCFKSKNPKGTANVHRDGYYSRLYTNSRILEFKDEIKPEDVDFDLALPSTMNYYYIWEINPSVSDKLTLIKTLKLPAFLETIVAKRFNFLDKAISLRKITVDKRNPRFKIKDGYLVEYYKGLCYLIRPVDALKREYKVPSGIDYIFDGAFKNLQLVTKIEISDSVKGIGNEAFLGCPNLEEIRGCENVEFLGSYLFCYDRSLKEFNIPSKLINASSLAFYNMPSTLKIAGGSDRLYSKDGLIFKKNRYRKNDEVELISVPGYDKDFLITPVGCNKISYSALNNTNIKYLYLSKDIADISFYKYVNQNSKLEAIYIDKDTYEKLELFSNEVVDLKLKSGLLNVVYNDLDKEEIINNYFKEER